MAQVELHVWISKRGQCVLSVHSPLLSCVMQGFLALSCGAMHPGGSMRLPLNVLGDARSSDPQELVQLSFVSISQSPCRVGLLKPDETKWIVRGSPFSATRGSMQLPLVALGLSS